MWRSVLRILGWLFVFVVATTLCAVILAFFKSGQVGEKRSAERQNALRVLKKVWEEINRDQSATLVDDIKSKIEGEVRAEPEFKLDEFEIFEPQDEDSVIVAYDGPLLHGYIGVLFKSGMITTWGSDRWQDERKLLKAHTAR